MYCSVIHCTAENFTAWMLLCYAPRLQMPLLSHTSSQLYLYFVYYIFFVFCMCISYLYFVHLTCRLQLPFCSFAAVPSQTCVLYLHFHLYFCLNVCLYLYLHLYFTFVFLVVFRICFLQMPLCLCIPQVSCALADLESKLCSNFVKRIVRCTAYTLGCLCIPNTFPIHTFALMFTLWTLCPDEAVHSSSDLCNLYNAPNNTLTW